MAVITRVLRPVPYRCSSRLDDTMAGGGGCVVVQPCTHVMACGLVGKRQCVHGGGQQGEEKILMLNTIHTLHRTATLHGLLHWHAMLLLHQNLCRCGCNTTLAVRCLYLG